MTNGSGDHGGKEHKQDERAKAEARKGAKPTPKPKTAPPSLRSKPK